MVGLAYFALEYPPPVLPGRQLIVRLNLVFGVIECAGHLIFLLDIEFCLSEIFALLLLGIGEGLVELIIDQSVVLLKSWSVHRHYLIAGTALSLILKHFFQ